MEKINLPDYFNDLSEKNGVFYSGKTNSVSYPEGGNEFCYQVEETSYWFSHRNNCIIEAIKKHCPDRLLIDVGGGNGFVAKAMEDSGITTILAEPGEAGCINAKTRGVKNIVCTSLDENNFKADSVPAIGLFDVLEHMEDDLEFLKKTNKTLQKNGCLFLTVPAYNFIWSEADTNAGHFRRYTLRELKKKLVKTGFRIEYSTYFFSILPPFIFLFRTIKGKLIKKKSQIIVSKNKPAHQPRKGIAGKVLDKLWKLEIKLIRAGRRIPFGGSCLLVARKNNVQ